jgi:hypothetical protein
MCDLAPVLAIHTAEYVNDLLQLTLDTKAARKIGFPLSKLVERELIIAQGTITGAQNHLIPKCRLILQAAHIMPLQITEKLLLVE